MAQLAPKSIQRFLGHFAIATVTVVCTGCHDGRRSVAPGINDSYKHPDVSVWVSRFESESREIYHLRHEIVDALNLQSGMNIADIGAGTGLFVPLFAERVGPSGRVYAVDVVPEFIDHIKERVRGRGLKNVTTILCKEDSVELPANSVDIAFVCDTYHHFEYPEATVRSIRRALRPNGSLFVIDFERIPGQSREWVLNHVRAGRDTVISELTSWGIEMVPDQSKPVGLTENYFLQFKRRR